MVRRIISGHCLLSVRNNTGGSWVCLGVLVGVSLQVLHTAGSPVGHSRLMSSLLKVHLIQVYFKIWPEATCLNCRAGRETLNAKFVFDVTAAFLTIGVGSSVHLRCVEDSHVQL